MIVMRLLRLFQRFPRKKRVEIKYRYSQSEIKPTMHFYTTVNTLKDNVANISSQILNELVCSHYKATKQGFNHKRIKTVPLVILMCIKQVHLN